MLKIKIYKTENKSKNQFQKSRTSTKINHKPQIINLKQKKCNVSMQLSQHNPLPKKLRETLCNKPETKNKFKSQEQVQKSTTNHKQ